MTGAARRIRAIASRLFTDRTIERVVDPILADVQCEYDEARTRGQRWRARLTLARGSVAFARALFWLGVRAAWDDGRLRSDVARTGFVAAITTVVVTLMLMLPPLLNYDTWHGDPAFGALLSITLIPQALPLSLPAGLCVAVLWATRGKMVTWLRVGTVLAVALAFSTSVWMVLEWLMPEANQGFRELVAARVAGRPVVLEPGLNELGLSRLGQRSDPASVSQYQLLWALCFASVPLSVLALGVARFVRGTVSAVLLAMALANAYFAVVWVSAAKAVWTANVVFLLIGVALLVRPIYLKKSPNVA